MPNPDQHGRQAVDNLGLHEQLAREGTHPDWDLTILFYAALHYVDAYLCPDEPRNHAQRNGRIRDLGELWPIWPSYKLLFERSLDARYECYDPTPEQLQDYRRLYFDPIQSHLLSLLKAIGRA